MKRFLFRTLHDFPEKEFPQMVLALGNFDGVHCGHRTIIQEVCKRAGKRGGVPALMSFTPHPSKVIPQAKVKVPQILSETQKTERIFSLGIQCLILLPFTEELAETPALQFLQEQVMQPLAPAEIVIGHDFNFGRKREGTPQFLRSLEKELSFELTVINEVLIRNKRVSSSAIRTFITEGRLSEAEEFLHAPVALSGTVVKGEQKGRTIGFPTANIAVENEVLPPPGVYGGWGVINGKKEPAVINIGTCPTMKRQTKPSVEVHFPDLTEYTEMYGEKREVFLEFYLREERMFNSVEELQSRIASDIEETKKRREKETEQKKEQSDN